MPERVKINLFETVPLRVPPRECGLPEWTSFKLEGFERASDAEVDFQVEAHHS